MVIEKDKNISTLGLLAILLFIGFGVSSVIAYAGGGFDSIEVLFQFAIYGIAGLAGAAMIYISWVVVQKRATKEYMKTIYFNSPQGFLKKMGNWRMALFSLVFFFPVFFVLVLREQIQLTGVGALIEQQFTAGGSIAFSTTLITISENLLLFGLMAVIIAFWVIPRAIRKKWDSTNYSIIVGFMFFALPGLLGLANHLLRYGAQDYSLAVVFLFWALGGLLTFFTRSFIPFLIAHMVNNLFIKLSKFFSSDVVIIILVIIWLILIGLLVFGKNNKKGVKQDA